MFFLGFPARFGGVSWPAGPHRAPGTVDLPLGGEPRHALCAPHRRAQRRAPEVELARGRRGRFLRGK